MDQLYFEIDPNEGGWLLRLFMGNAEHETRQFPDDDDGHHQARTAGLQLCEEWAGGDWALLRD
ncbi:hypothetical protein EWE75_12415 [Sphingomonas populi]|uniref:Uncharacterized protein n=1 Tax=Sphingomonas populi TaxID=2484750 RepID=A0A4Q6Y302_9SPHN|nr:hypothetical protein [Sphingomonas populi]RZF64144.1 hypothetical protein EWE75_12415 [Sphingomonas populi]